jgi:hypothetical protein
MFVISSFLGPNILFSTLTVSHSLRMKYQVSHQYKTTGKIRNILKFLELRQEDEI